MRIPIHPRATLVLAAVFGTILCFSDTALAEEEKDWTLSFQAGGEYASNLSVEEIDLDLGANDTGATVEVSAGYTLDLGQGTELSLTYDFWQTDYLEHDEFNMMSHILGASGTLEFSDLFLTSSFTVVDVQLAKDDFLGLQIFRQSVARMFGSRLYVEGSYSYMSKTFETLPTRDADTHVAGLDAYYFYNQSKSYVSGGVRHETEEAVGPLYDYQAIVTHADWKIPLLVLGDTAELKFGVRLTDRNYTEVIPALASAREDRYYQFGVTLSAPIAKAAEIVADYKYIDRQSNLASADYSESIFALALKYSF